MSKLLAIANLSVPPYWGFAEVPGVGVGRTLVGVGWEDAEVGTLGGTEVDTGAEVGTTGGTGAAGAIGVGVGSKVAQAIVIKRKTARMTPSHAIGRKFSLALFIVHTSGVIP